MILFAGPCVIESYELLKETCEFLLKVTKRYDIEFYFKSSYDKANRSSVNSFRGPGLEEGLKMLSNIKNSYGVKIITDVHETNEVSMVAEVADVIQYPSLSCRQYKPFGKDSK